MTFRRAANAVRGVCGVRGVRGVRMQSSWTPAVARGKVPAYDAALAYISEDAAQQASRAEDAAKAGSDAAVVDALRVTAEINLPHVREQFISGEYDLTRPVFRHLREQAWRRGGPLAQLSERLVLMKVLPDVLPEITPTVDLQVAFGTGRGVGDHGGEGGDILAGVFLPPRLTRSAPALRATAFHSDERKYTLLLVDPDSPDVEASSFSTYVHWMVTDIVLSTAKSEVSGTELLPYIPPHPQQGTPYHRYTTVLLEQQSGAVAAVPRERFNMREFIAANSLKPAGIHFWREQWSPASRAVVSAIYADLGVEEPRYGLPGRQDKLKDELGRRHSRYYPQQ
ncbi:mitochondrial 54S ribosomal protein YmL35 [Malassezia cuniculi]|uniref:Mitochondrial 54S ribosomal protein YmL35 n=1 Tax=Malassezia cuniculi TaxID=948313 RepID=A0AAF0EXE3_9BASI|nr:mitochondrial 54S ribosomal protein YmL35 [Malassezia cuniculi]